MRRLFQVSTLLSRRTTPRRRPLALNTKKLYPTSCARCSYAIPATGKEENRMTRKMDYDEISQCCAALLPARVRWGRPHRSRVHWLLHQRPAATEAIDAIAPGADSFPLCVRKPGRVACPAHAVRVPNPCLSEVILEIGSAHAATGFSAVPPIAESQQPDRERAGPLHGKPFARTRDKPNTDTVGKTTGKRRLSIRPRQPHRHSPAALNHAAPLCTGRYAN